jgi:hypothetical protein
MYDIEKKLRKKTLKKIYISGNSIEYYIYEKPLFYNFPGDSSEQTPTDTKDEQNIKQKRLSSIIRSRDKIRRLVNSNVNRSSSTRTKFLTLTFRDNITDLKEARYFFRLYNQRLQYRYPNTKYLGVAEIQKQRYETYGHKVWHFHVIYFNLPFIYGIQSVIHSLWQKGFVKINAVSHAKNVGAYVAKYLRKDLFEPELFGQKSFFCSKGLYQPILYRNQITVENYLNLIPHSVEYENEYQSSTHGRVIYKVLKTNYNETSKRQCAYPRLRGNHLQRARR